MPVRNVGQTYLSGSLTSGNLGGTPTAGGETERAGCGSVLTTLVCTLAEDDITYGDKVGCSPIFQTAAADSAAQCGSVLTTLACTLDAETTGRLSGDAVIGDCKHVLWTAGCTFAEEASGAAECKVVMWTAGCTFPAAGAEAAAADCKNIMWTAGCTF